MLILLSGIPGCAKSALCEEILNTPGGLDDSRPVHSLMGDRIKGTEHLATFSSSFGENTKIFVSRCIDVRKSYIQAQESFYFHWTCLVLRSSPANRAWIHSMKTKTTYIF
jgi:hypothetical protein